MELEQAVHEHSSIDSTPQPMLLSGEPHVLDDSIRLAWRCKEVVTVPRYFPHYPPAFHFNEIRFTF